MFVSTEAAGVKLIFYELAFLLPNTTWNRFVADSRDEGLQDLLLLCIAAPFDVFYGQIRVK